MDCGGPALRLLMEPCVQRPDSVQLVCMPSPFRAMLGHLRVRVLCVCMHARVGMWACVCVCARAWARAMHTAMRLPAHPAALCLAPATPSAYTPRGTALVQDACAQLIPSTWMHGHKHLNACPQSQHMDA